MKKHIAIFHRQETPAASMVSDVMTFGFLTFCIWFSWDMGGGVWTFVTVGLFFVSLSSKWFLGPGATQSGWVKLQSKQQAIDWAASLPDDGSVSRGRSP